MTLQERLDKFAQWTTNNVEHGIYIPLPSPETTQAIEKDLLYLIDSQFGHTKTYNETQADIHKAINKYTRVIEK